MVERNGGEQSRAPKVVDLDGLRVVLVENDRQSLTVRALVGSGSREEADKVAGAAHYLEHFVFKGTKKFPGMSDIDAAIERVGGEKNASTGYNGIGFWTKVGGEHTGLAVKAVGQLITQPLLPARHFDKERGTILEEMKRGEDVPNAKAFKSLRRILFGETRMGRPVIGTRESLAAMKVSDLREYMDSWFVKDNVLVGVVGMFDEKKLLALISREFEKLIGRDDKSPQKYSYQHAPQEEIRMDFVERKVEQAQLAIGLAALPIGHPLNDALDLVNVILGDGTVSRFWQEVREKRGWAYSIGSGTYSYVDTGAFLVGAGLPKDKINEAVGLITDIMWGLGGNGKWGIKKKELAMAKECYKGRISLSYDEPEEVLGGALYDLMFEDKIYTPGEIKNRIDAVTMEDVRSVCRMVFRPENLNLVVLGDYKKMPVDL